MIDLAEKDRALWAYVHASVQRSFPEQGLLVKKPRALRAWLAAYATTTFYGAILDAATPGESDKVQPVPRSRPTATSWPTCGCSTRCRPGCRRAVGSNGWPKLPSISWPTRPWPLTCSGSTRRRSWAAVAAAEACGVLGRWWGRCSRAWWRSASPRMPRRPTPRSPTCAPGAAITRSIWWSNVVTVGWWPLESSSPPLPQTRTRATCVCFATSAVTRSNWWSLPPAVTPIAAPTGSPSSRRFCWDRDLVRRLIQGAHSRKASAWGPPETGSRVWC